MFPSQLPLNLAGFILLRYPSVLFGDGTRLEINSAGLTLGPEIFPASQVYD